MAESSSSALVEADPAERRLRRHGFSRPVGGSRSCASALAAQPKSRTPLIEIPAAPPAPNVPAPEERVQNRLVRRPLAVATRGLRPTHAPRAYPLRPRVQSSAAF